jgi:hypothetical protein
MFNPDFYSFFKDVFHFAQSVPAGADAAYMELVRIADIVVILGLGLALVLLVMNVYISIRLEQLEHAGFHHREMADHLHHPPEYQPEVKNKRWEGIALLASSPNESDWRRAILDADIMLSEMLRDKGYMGETIGDQLKMANPLQFTTVDIAWEAHRMRNALAHLGEAFPLSERDARATIDQYRRVFEEFDYI